MVWMYQSSQHFLEDFIKLGFLDFPVSGFVDSLNKLCDLLLGDLSVGFHVVKGIIDEGVNLILIQGVAVINVVFAEHCIDGFLELLVGV